MTTYATEQGASAARGRPSGRIWLSWFLRCLTASWVATAFVYALSIGTVPEPIVGLVISIAFAALVATALAFVIPEDPTRAAAVTPLAAGWSEAPPHHRSEPLSPALPLDLSVYPRAERRERQCPRCGSFAVTEAEDAGRQSNTCRICNQVWRSGVGVAEPDVVVRSWLHR